jgi:Na+-driven multidrug efflux pump
MLTAPIGPTLLRLAAPNIVSMVMSSLTMMTEAFYVGQLGTAPLAGLALGFPMMMLMGMLSAGAFGGRGGWAPAIGPVPRKWRCMPCC